MSQDRVYLWEDEGLIAGRKGQRYSDAPGSGGHADASRPSGCGKREGGTAVPTCRRFKSQIVRGPRKGIYFQITGAARVQWFASTGGGYALASARERGGAVW
eukprot:scaffold10399_cov94-Isochrysis_galbana.AAC.9